MNFKEINCKRNLRLFNLTLIESNKIYKTNHFRREEHIKIVE